MKNLWTTCDSNSHVCLYPCTLCIHLQFVCCFYWSKWQTHVTMSVYVYMCMYYVCVYCGMFTLSSHPRKVHIDCFSLFTLMSFIWLWTSLFVSALLRNKTHIINFLGKIFYSYFSKSETGTIYIDHLFYFCLTSDGWKWGWHNSEDTETAGREVWGADWLTLQSSVNTPSFVKQVPGPKGSGAWNKSKVKNKQWTFYQSSKAKSFNIWQLEESAGRQVSPNSNLIINKITNQFFYYLLAQGSPNTGLVFWFFRH